MKLSDKRSTNVEDHRRDQAPRPPSRDPFSYAQDRDTVNSAKGGYNGPSNVTPPKNNPFQDQIDAIQRQGEAGHAALKDDIGKRIGKLNRTDEYDYNVRSRARTGALRPNTRGDPASSLMDEHGMRPASEQDDSKSDDLKGGMKPKPHA